MAKYTLPFNKSVKSNHKWNFLYVQNNHIKKRKIFSVRSSPDPPDFEKIPVRSRPDPAKIDFSPEAVRSSPDPCSSLADSGLMDAMVVDWCSAVHDMSVVTEPLSHICNWSKVPYIL